MMIAGAIAGEVVIRNISMLSKQADTAVCRALERAGASIIVEQDRITVSHRELHAFELTRRTAPICFRHWWRLPQLRRA